MQLVGYSLREKLVKAITFNVKLLYRVLLRYFANF